MATEQELLDHIRSLIDENTRLARAEQFWKGIVFLVFFNTAVLVGLYVLGQY